MTQSFSRKRFTAAAGAAGVAACVPQPARAAQFNWKWGIEVSADHPIPVRCAQAFTRIRRETNGQLDIQSFVNSTLGSVTSIINLLRSGAVEMTTYAGGLLDTLVSLASIENVGYAFPNRNAVFAAMDGQLGALIRQAIAEKGIMVLDRIWDNGWRDFTTSVRPIRSAQDLSGLNIRVSPGKLRVDTIRTLGAAAIPISSNELYTALQTRLVDGQESPLIAVESFRMFEVQKYASLTHHQWSGFWTLINMEKWNSLPPSFQEIMRKEMDRAVQEQRRDTEIAYLSLQDKLHRQGLIFNTPPPDSFKEKLVAGGYYGRWKTEFGDRAWTTLEKYTGHLG